MDFIIKNLILILNIKLSMDNMIFKFYVSGKGGLENEINNNYNNSINDWEFYCPWF